MNDQNTAQQNLANSPLAGFGIAKEQAQATQQQIQDKNLGMIARRNQQVNSFLETLSRGETDLAEYEYFPTFDQLQPDQQNNLLNLRSQFNLSDLVPDDNITPTKLLEGLNAKQMAEINKSFIPPQLKTIQDIEIEYDPFTFYKEPPARPMQPGADLSGFRSRLGTDLGQQVLDKYGNKVYSGQESNPQDNTTYGRKGIQSIINNFSRGNSPLTADDYIKASEMTGVPVDALLTQGALESQFGTTGAAINTKNVGNVGNTDDGSLKYFDSHFDGLLAQAKLLKDAYADDTGNFTADHFISTNFTGKFGRYATDPAYGDKYSKLLQQVRSSLYQPPVPANLNNQGDFGNREVKVLDTVEWGAQFISDSTPLTVLKPPVQNWNSVNPTIYRDVPAGTASFNISQQTGRQINFGTDFLAPIGTPVLATADAEVVNVGNAPLTGGGNNVRLKFQVNGQDYYADYNHLDNWNVKVGDRVKAGAIIGTSGNTGNSSAPHLDFSVFRLNNGQYQFIDTSSIFN